MAHSSQRIDPPGEFDIARAMALSERSVKSRLIFAGVFAAACAPVLTWPAVSAWFALVTAWELLGRSVTDRWLLRRAGGPTLGAFAALKGASSLIFGALGGLTLANGSPLAAVLGAAWLTGSILHVFVYYGSNRRLLIATMTPPCGWAAVGAFGAFGFSPEALIALAAVLSTLSAGLIFIADRKALLHQLERERLALSAAEEASSAKSQFLATMSHELRTPLNAIIGYSEMLNETATEAGRTADATDLDRVLSASRHLLNMINEILDFSKIEAGRIILQPTDLDVERVANEALDAVRPLAGARGNTLQLDLEPDGVGSVRNDAFRLHQCLVNLLSNAAKFTKAGSIVLRVRRRGEQLAFAVADTGIGIAPEKLEHLFQPFVQADPTMTRTHGGTGLGLVISRRLAQLMGGDVAVGSIVGEGSTFTLSIAAQLAGEGEHAAPHAVAA